MSRKKAPQRGCKVRNAAARTLIDCSPHRTTGGASIPGLTELHAEHESPHERLAIAHLALCVDVCSLASQPCQSDYTDGSGVLRRYTPDFAVATTCAPRVFLEVKSLAYLVHENGLDKYVAIGKHYFLQAQPFAFLTDAQLLVQPRASSVRLLFRYATSVAPTAVWEKASVILASGPTQISDLCAQASLQLVDVYTLIATKRLCIDWDQPLSSTALVSLSDQPFGGLKLEHILHSTRFSGLLEELALGRRPADQQLLADAAAWRQSRRPFSPFHVVGGFPVREVVYPLGDTGSPPHAPSRRDDCAAGGRDGQADVQR